MARPTPPSGLVPPQRVVHAVAGGLAGLILIVDLQVPLGGAVAMLYVLVILLGLWSDWQPYPAVAAAGATALLAVDTAIDWSDAVPPMVYVNRSLLVLLFVGAALLVARFRRLEQATHAQIGQLADFKRALDHAAIVATTDVTGRITYANDRFCDISGYTRSELLGQDHRIINSGHHPKAFIRDLWRTIASGRVWHGEIRNRAKDGRVYWVDTTIVPFVTAAGKPFQYIAIRADITARKLAEERLTQQAALAQVGQMAAVVAHEVRNPLAGIKGAIQILISRRDRADTELPVMRDIVTRIDSLSDLINDLMVYARPRPPRLTRVDLLGLVNEAMSAARRDPVSHQVEISVEGESLQLTADEELIRAAVLNLLLNAAQAMNGRGRISVTIAQREASGIIEVTDTGPGIPLEIRERVFEPFFTTKARGGGLGLSIARRTAELHGGSLGLDCPPGGGTIVTLTVPVHRPPEHLQAAGAGEAGLPTSSF